MVEAGERARMRKLILENCFEMYEEPITLSAGDQADNKLELEQIRDISAVRELVVPALADLAMRHQPEFIIAVPNGANWLADAVAIETDCYVAHLHKDSNGKIDYEDEFIDYEETVSRLERGVLLEDVFRTFRNTRASLAVKGLQDKIKGVVAIWDRAPNQERTAPHTPHVALISEHIPEMLTGQPES